MASLLTAAEEELCELFADSNELFGRIGFGTVEAVLNGKDTAVIGLEGYVISGDDAEVETQTDERGGGMLEEENAKYMEGKQEL